MSESIKQSATADADRNEAQIYAVFDGDEPQQRQSVFAVFDHRARTIRVIRGLRRDTETGMQHVEQLFRDQRQEARYACMWLSFFFIVVLLILAYMTMAGQMTAGQFSERLAQLEDTVNEMDLERG